MWCKQCQPTLIQLVGLTMSLPIMLHHFLWHVIFLCYITSFLTSLPMLCHNYTHPCCVAHGNKHLLVAMCLLIDVRDKEDYEHSHCLLARHVTKVDYFSESNGQAPAYLYGHFLPLYRQKMETTTFLLTVVWVLVFTALCTIAILFHLLRTVSLW